jgi:hypothetical protein
MLVNEFFMPVFNISRKNYSQVQPYFLFKRPIIDL